MDTPPSSSFAAGGGGTTGYTYRSQAEQSMHNTTMASVSSPTANNNNNNNRSGQATSSASRMSPQVLRDQESEIARLNKQLFNMKLRVFYLEERLAKSGRQGGEDMGALMKENYDQAMLLDEKTAELEERNLLLIKARNAIESLQTDLEMARGGGGANGHHHQEAEAGQRLEEQTKKEFQEYRRKVDAELKAQKEAHQQVLTSLAETGSQVPALEAQLADKTEQLARAERRAQDSLQDAERYKSQLANLSAKVQETTSESFRQLKDEIQRKDNQIHRLQLEADDLRVQLLSRASLLKEWEKKHEALKKQAAEIAHMEALEIKRLEDENRRLRNDHSGDADERGDLALQNSRLTQALQQARDRIHKMEAEARSTTDDSEQRLKAVREAEDRVRKREVELELKSAKHEADLRTVTSEETLQLQQDIHQLNGKLSVVQYKRETLERDLEGERSRNLELSHRIRDLSENNAELRQQLQQLQQQLQTNYYQTDGDTALVINMQTSNDPHGKARLQLNPQVRAQSEWLAREQRKLARAKEQYARDIRQLQRQAESSLAQAERNLRLSGGGNGKEVGGQQDAALVKATDANADLLQEMKQWESNIIAALRAFLPADEREGGARRDDRRERQEVLNHLRRFQNAQRFFTTKTREVREGLQQQQAQLNDVLARQEQRLHAATQKLARVQAEVSRAEMQRVTERGANQQAQSLRQQGLEKQLQAKTERVNRLEKNNHVLILELEDRQAELLDCRSALKSCEQQLSSLRRDYEAVCGQLRSKIGSSSSSSSSAQLPRGSGFSTSASNGSSNNRRGNPVNSQTVNATQERARSIRQDMLYHPSPHRPSTTQAQNQYNHSTNFHTQQSPAASTLMSNAGRTEPLSGGAIGTAGLSPAGQQTKQRLDTLHEDMLERLARIGSDLQSTATRLEAFNTPTRRR